MNKFVFGLILGVIFTAVVVFFLSPGIILKEDQSKYGFEESLARLETTIKEGGWSVVTLHNLQASMLKNGKDSVNSVVVIEMCNPDLAEKILKTDDERIVTNMMPCRIALYEKSDGVTYFSRMNMGLLAKPLGKVAREQMRIAAGDMEKFLMELQ